MFIAPVYKPKNLKSIQIMVWHGNRRNGLTHGNNLMNRSVTRSAQRNNRSKLTNYVKTVIGTLAAIRREF